MPPDLDSAAVAEIRGIIVDALHDLDEIDAERPWDTVEVFVLKAEAMRHIVQMRSTRTWGATAAMPRP